MRSHHVIRWLAVPALVAGTAFGASAPAFAQQAPPPQQPVRQSVGISPVGATRTDPNGGQWFTLDLGQGQHGTGKVRIANPADAEQTVKLYLTDVDFSANGSPQLSDHPTDVGTWGAFENATVTVPAKSVVEQTFSIAVPNDAEPGDHVGAVVAESAPQSQGDNTILKVVRRVASRLYVTVPGEARADVNIAKLTVKRDSAFFTRQITATVMLHNGGRVRVSPTVFINGQKAIGSGRLLTHSVEPYIATIKVPVWGGPISVHAEVHTTVGTQAGPARQASTSVFVIPWVLLIALALLVGLFFLVRWLWRKRGGKYAAVQADLRRFERLLQQQRADGVETADVAEEAELAIKAAIKQAGRSGDSETEIKLREKLTELREQEAANPPPTVSPLAPTIAPPVAEAGGDVPPASPPPAPAPEVVADAAEGRTAAIALRELAVAAPGAKRFALIREARAFGLDVIEAHPDELAAMPDDLRARLLNAPAHGNGNGNGHENGHDPNGDSGARQHEPQGSEIA
jgi:hypothetical protein